MVKRISAREARGKFSDLLGSVHYRGDVVIVERSGRPMVAVISVEMYERLTQERQTSFEVVDRIRSRVPEITPETVEEDVAAAIGEVRTAYGKGRP